MFTHQRTHQPVCDMVTLGETSSLGDLQKQADGRVLYEGADVTSFVTEVGRAVVQIDPSHELELHKHGGRLATAETWASYSTKATARLWQAIALLCFADPKGWSVAQMREVHFCRGRLNAAQAELDRDGGGWLEVKTQSVPSDPANTVVLFQAVRNWARKALLPVPLLYPDQHANRSAGGAAPSRPAGRREPKASRGANSRQSRSRTSAFVRVAELVEDIVPFSRATLWRKVKAGDFPAPVKLSDAVTAWKREEVEAWLAAQTQVKSNRRDKSVPTKAA